MIIILKKIPTLSQSLIFGALLGIAATTKFTAVLLAMLLATIIGIRSFERRFILLALPVMVYCSYQSLAIAWYPLRDSSLAMLSAYFFFFVTSPFATSGMMKILQKKGEVENGVLVGSLISFTFLALEFMFTETCRAKVMSSNPLMPPVVLVPLIFYLVASRLEAKRNNMLDNLVIIGLIVAVGAFSGARMAFYSVIFGLILLVICSGIRRNWSDIKSISVLFGIGVSLIFFIDLLSGCGFLSRIANQKQAVLAISSILGENPIQIAESSTGYRWQMWSNIITFFVEEASLNAWLWGVGRQNEIDIINFGMNTQFTQAHNQFLSWLACGGILGLCTVIFMYSTTIKNSSHQFPSFVFVVISGANISTNGPFYDIPTASQLLLVLLYVSVSVFHTNSSKPTD